jgi:uncharacterized protein YjbI with pentapeptide repeats
MAALDDPIPDLLKAVNDASGKAFALWLTFLSVMIYLAIAIGTTTHVQLLLEAPVKLPLLGVDLPLFAFYEFAPPLFLVIHLYVLMQLYLLSRTLYLFDTKLRDASLIRKDRELIRSQLEKFVVTQLLIGAPDAWGIRQFLRLTVWLSFGVGPVLLLLAFQLQFLPYHSIPTTWTHRVVLLLDIALLLMLWPRVFDGSTRPSWPSRYAWRFTLGGLLAALVVFSISVATVPGEYIEQSELRSRWLVRTDPLREQPFWLPTHELFEGRIDAPRSRSISLFARNLVLVDARLVEPDRDKLAKLDRTLSLRGRDLQLAVATGADLRKADLTGADLTSANLDGANLDGATLSNATLSNANLTLANLSHTTLAKANLSRAFLGGANLTGADMVGANLGRAYLGHTTLPNANLSYANLGGAYLFSADLGGANLDGTNLLSAKLLSANLQDATLEQSQLDQACGVDARLPPGLTLKPCPEP